MRQTHVITTPENVDFEFELAGVGSRALSWAIDVVVMGSLIGVFGCALSMLTPLVGGFALALLFVTIFVVQWGYGALLEWRFAGQTVGKRLVGLRTLSDRGLRVGFLPAVIRNFVRIVDLLPGLYLVGGMSALLDARGRRLGDIAAGTIVVRERRPVKPGTIVPLAERHNTFLRDPNVQHAIRCITPKERAAMVAVGLRRDQLPLSVRQELFVRLSRHLERRLGVTRPSHFSEEKFVLNVTAVLLRRGAIEPSARR